MNDQIRRNMPLFPISIVKQLTQLSARQIRYYEEHQLIHPARTKGNHRLFSFNDVDRLLEIKSMIEQGINIAGIKQVFAMKEQPQTLIKQVQGEQREQHEVSKKELLKHVKQDLIYSEKQGRSSLIQGELSRFFH